MDSPSPIWLGPFFGSNFGFYNYEILTIQRISPDLWREESALMRTKWFDYRRLHPLQATYYLAHCYNQSYRQLITMCHDRAAGRRMRAFRGSDFLEHRERLSFWRLRQLCDRLGMRYDFLACHAMRWGFKRGWTRGPRPQHLYTNEDLIADTVIAWQDECAEILQVARDPWFRVENFTGHADQLEHERFVVGQVARRASRHALTAALYAHDAIRVEEAIRAFGAQAVDDALDRVHLPDPHSST
jgi:hypothetical protein